MPDDRQFYLSKAQALCSAFAKGSSPKDLASFFSKDGIAYEHGPSDIRELPFLGRQFKGTEDVIKYFEIITRYLKVVDEMKFSDWTVDTQPDDVSDEVKGVVTTRGTTSFEYASTGKRWKEQFYYRLELDKDGLMFRYEVWADPLSAFLASR